jgi:osmoprotectant transport system substrate-binding protein
MRRTALPLLTAVMLVGLAACGSSGAKTSTKSAPKEPSLVIGSANFPENVILADIYADALRKAGLKVTTKLNIGAREVYFKALEKGELNVFPEYNGSVLGYLDKSSTASSTAGVNTALAKVLPSNLEALTSSSAQDNDSVTVTQAFATAHHLKTIADLVPIQSTITFGGSPEFQTREQGLVGLKKDYGLTKMKYKALDEAGPLTIAALKDGTVQAADIFTTDPSVSKDHFVALADPKHVFPAQNVTPIIAKSVATPLITKTLDAISKALTTKDLIELVGGVVNDKQDPGTVAESFVSQEKLG